MNDIHCNLPGQIVNEMDVQEEKQLRSPGQCLCCKLGPQGKQRQEEEEEIKNENSCKPRSISTQVIGSVRVQMSRMEFVENPIPKSVSPSLGEPL